MKEKQYAYVTFIIRNDTYVTGALVLAYSLLKQCVTADLVCLVTEDISQEARQALGLVYTKVITVDAIYVSNDFCMGRGDRPILFTRFQSLRLGRDGDLGCHYDKIVMIDADVLPICDYQSLFDIKAPAAIINESKDHWLGTYEGCDNRWASIYGEICPHGHKVPSYLTDRVWEDPYNLGMNACLWVLEPSMDEWYYVMDTLKEPKIAEKIAGFRWPEMQFATWFWSGQWHSIDYKFCAYNGQPHISQAYGTHFAGFKPWHDKDRKVLRRYLAYDDFQLWYKTMVEMVVYVYPDMQVLPRIRRILRFYLGETDPIELKRR